MEKIISLSRFYIFVDHFFANRINLFRIFFYSDDNRISNKNKKPAYVLVPTAGIWNDGFDKWHPTYVSIKRVKYGNELSKKFSVPLIIAGAGNTIVKEADFLSNFFDYDFHIVENESRNTYEMAKNLKNFIKNTDGPLLLATSPMHNKRTILALESQNFSILIPDDYLRNTKKNYSLIPSFYGISNFNDIIYEALGICWYFITRKI